MTDKVRSNISIRNEDICGCFCSLLFVCSLWLMVFEKYQKDGDLIRSDINKNFIKKYNNK
jgi:hypothetical protein